MYRIIYIHTLTNSDSDIIVNSELCKIWDFTLLARKLTFYCLIYADRKHKIPGSETKDFIAHSQSNGRSFPIVSVSPCPHPPPQSHRFLHTQWIVVQQEDTQLGGFTASAASVNKPTFGGRDCASWRFLTAITTLRNISGREFVRVLNSWNTQQFHADTMADCLSKQFVFDLLIKRDFYFFNMFYYILHIFNGFLLNLQRMEEWIINAVL